MGKIGRILGYALRQWRWLLLIVGFSCAAAGAAALTPWPMKLLVDTAMGGQQPPAFVTTMLEWVHAQPTPASLVIFAAIASFVIFAINSLIDAAQSLGWTAAGQRMVYDLAGDLFARLSRMSLLFHGRTSVGDSLSRLSGDTFCVYTVVEGILVAPLQHLLTLAAIGTVAWQLDPQLAIASLAVTPVLGASAYFFGRRLRTRMKTSREAQARLTSFVHNIFGAIPLVQAFSAEKRNVEQFHVLAEDAVKANKGGLVLKQVYSSLNLAAATAGTSLVLYLGGKRVLEGALSLGSLLVFVAYLRLMQTAVQGLLSIYGNIKSAEASMDRVMELLDADADVKEAADATPLPGKERHDGTEEPQAQARRHEGEEKKIPGRSIEWRDVSFGYEKDRPVLAGLSLTVPAGRMLAVVGPTGAGKSTLVAMAPRLMDPWSGAVLIDGMDVRRVKLNELRASVSMVLQDPFLLPLSVAQNVAYGRPGATQKEIEAAAMAANAHEFITALPKGYDTILGERGVTLSGGQRQRLAIARAILKDAPVLILDEPTAALDAQTESDVMQAISRLMAGRTCIVIAHRLSTVKKADLIAVLESGRIAQLGKHEELVAQEGLYKQLCAVQFGAETAEGTLT